MAEADAGGELDPTVERLRLCVEQGRKITAEGDGFRLADDLVVPKVRGERGPRLVTCVGQQRTRSCVFS